MALVLIGAGGVRAQSVPDWRKIGGYSVDLMLASPATGPVDWVWFSPEGSTLYARATTGKIYQTADFETWSLAQDPPRPGLSMAAAVSRLPEAGSLPISPKSGSETVYALGRHLYRSNDGGHSWINLTAFKSISVIGPGQLSMAVSPIDPDQIVVANQYGVWRSLDGGLSWSGLNEFLPNLTVRKILSTPAGGAGTRVQTADPAGQQATLELPPGGSIWHRVVDPGIDHEPALVQMASSVLGPDITAAASANNTIYAGSVDGRIWVSIDGGRTFAQTQPAPGTVGRVERIYVDPDKPNVALAALSGKGPHVLRTMNGGNFWDSMDGNLPDAPAHAVVAERASGAVYVATDKGIFWARTDLEVASNAPANWTSLSAKVLPDVPARDVRLDPSGVQLYAALDGYGVWAMAAPHRRSNLRIVNAADFSTRAAAPGSLLSVSGARVNSVRGGDLDYPVLAVIGEESQIQVPFEAVGPSVLLALQTPNGVVNRSLPVQPVSPAILVGRDGTPTLWDADSGLPLDVRNPAHGSGRIQIWATGLGKVTPDGRTGQPAPLENPPSVVAAVRVYLDHTALQVTRATLLPGYVGFYLIEVQLPLINNAGTSELYVSADGQESNRVQLVIEP